MKKRMKLSKEASRLWVQQFGKKQKAIDFSGREIIKAAYNDRNSRYGWNIDHILPQSRGGTTTDYNLICCHILTNDEKEDKFPCFKANAKEFEIKKRRNHYEIIARTAEPKAEGVEIVNFQDAAQGLKCWKQCKTRDKNVFVGYVKVKVETVNNSDMLIESYWKFLSELFGTECIFAENNKMGYLNSYSMYGSNLECIFTVIVGSIPTKEATQNLLDDCVILNTYNDYFTRKTGFKSIQIVCGMRSYDNHFKMSMKYKEDIVDARVQFIDSLMIDELVKINTSAEKELQGIFPQYGYYPYNYICTKLKENLLKRI